jgi:cytochrome c-type biogenesis protein CcmH/NrfF
MLRAEIEHRVAAGEPSDAIEDDLARRYGEAVRAVPRTWDPRLPLGVGLGSVVLLGALVVVRKAFRLRLSPGIPAVDPAEIVRDLKYEAQLDDESSISIDRRDRPDLSSLR